MADELGGRLQVYPKPEYPPELLERRYAVTRDEMLWRQYDSSRMISDPEAARCALNILRLIREAPE